MLWILAACVKDPADVEPDLVFDLGEEDGAAGCFGDPWFAYWYVEVDSGRKEYLIAAEDWVPAGPGVASSRVSVGAVRASDDGMVTVGIDCSVSPTAPLEAGAFDFDPTWTDTSGSSPDLVLHVRVVVPDDHASDASDSG